MLDRIQTRMGGAEPLRNLALDTNTCTHVPLMLPVLSNPLPSQPCNMLEEDTGASARRLRRPMTKWSFDAI